MMILGYAAKNVPYRHLRVLYHVDITTFHKFMVKDLPAIAAYAEQTWIPGVDSQAHIMSFKYYPECAFAGDSTPLRCPNAELMNRFLSHAL
jgi:hypothetical protein